MEEFFSILERHWFTAFMVAFFIILALLALFQQKSRP